MITKRSKRVRAVAIVLLIAGLWWLSGHLWYVEGAGYCVGDMVKCYGGAL